MKVYLAGPITDCSSEEATGWRNYLKSRLPEITFLDPVDFGFTTGQQYERYLDLVPADLEAIRQCDVFVANMYRPSIGTAMELWEAHCKRKHIVVVTKMRHPWLRYVAHEVYQDIYEVVGHLTTLTIVH